MLQAWANRHGDSVSICPLPSPSTWKYEYRKSGNWRRRKKKQREIRSLFSNLVSVVNGLDAGETFGGHTVSGGSFESLKQVAEAQRAALNGLLSEATQFARVRRESAPSGVHGASARRQHATANLIKNSVNDGSYVQVSKQMPMIPMIADALDEPNNDRTVDMLLGLDAEESQYYSKESNVLDPAGKAACMLEALEQRYAFVGGSHYQYLRYWHRSDLPNQMWLWALASEAKGIAGFTAVAKKSEGAQRKLLMACPTDYMMTDPRSRSEEGMKGAAALTCLHSQGEDINIAALDESNAFSYVVTPPWMWPWFAAPPVRASEVWTILPIELRDRCNPADWVAAQYQRLPMGFTHSVHILMNINMRHIGMALLSSSKLQVNAPLKDSAEALHNKLRGLEPVADQMGDDMSDETWFHLHSKRKDFSAEAASLRSMCVDEFVDSLRAAKNLPYRVIVVCLAFAGARRKGDIQDWLETWAIRDGFKLLVFSFDLGADGIWDFSEPKVFHILLSLTEQGFIDIWFGGPPCSTVSAACFVYFPGGPRPVRSRSNFFGGFMGLQNLNH